jgi:hypothetical protein
VGVTAYTNDDKTVGDKILVSMEGEKVTDCTFKRSLQVITMDAKASVKIIQHLGQ